VSYALLWGAVACVVSAILGGPLVTFLRARKIGKAIAAETPEHEGKAGTPTMGGILIVGVMVVFGLAVAVPKDRDVLLSVAVAVIVGAMGFYDDLGTILGREQREAHDRINMIQKIVGFAVVGIGAAWILYSGIDAPRMLVPHYGNYNIGPVYILIAIAVIVAASSAEGVTDGLDMLSGSTNAVAFAAFGAIALMQDNEALAAFCFVTVGALAGFLWWNAYPARIFMGDVGALPLGAVLAVVALQTGWWLLLPVIGVVFVAEALSCVLQIGSFRLRGGKRIFKRAPFHHHFELIGWHETQVTVRFLFVGVVGGLAGVGLAALS
jgi:phospho-N-acetylmuramoyl-pentapeptide-transferase